MNSKITINDLKEEINEQIDHYTLSLFNRAHIYENISSVINLKVWYNNTEFTIKLLKKLKLLKFEIDNNDSLTDYQIDQYHILASKPERIDERCLARKIE